MLNFRPIVFQALAYSMVLPICGASLCWLDLWKCRLVDDVTILEAAPPVLFVFTIMFIAGAVAAKSYTLLTNLIWKGNPKPPIGLVLVVASFCGSLPHLLWLAFSGGWPEAFYPHVNWVPFILGGIAIAMVGRMKWVVTRAA